MRQKLVRLGSSVVAVAYPPSLDVWFDGIVDTWDKNIARRKWVSLNACDEPSRFDVVASVGPPAARLDLGDALASFWERVSVLLIDDIHDALALHAAALDRGNGWVLLPGPSESDSYCSSLDLLKTPELFDADCQTTDAEAGGPALLG
jgi:hypothetical protein